MMTPAQVLGALLTVVGPAGLGAAADPAPPLPLPPTPLAVVAPSGLIRVAVRVDERGRPTFEVARRGVVVARGQLGLKFAGSGPLGEGLRIVAAHPSQHDETYAIPVGKAAQARDHHHELVVDLQEINPPARRLELAWRVWDDGVAFRYQVPAGAPGDLVLTDELTRLSFPSAGPTRALPLPGYTSSYEAYYESLPMAAIGPERLIGLPLLVPPAREGEAPPAPATWIAVTEANLTDYAGMYLSGVAGEPGTLATRLAPLPGGPADAKVRARAPFASPWRVLMMADGPGGLIESNLVFHLNEPSRIADPSWIKPGRTAFPWWSGYALEGVPFPVGVNTATMKAYIDFCAAHGIEYHTLDGLDIAWYGGPIEPDGPTDVTRAAPAIDLPELLRYARDRHVRLRLWLHWKALKPQIDQAFATYEAWGIEGVMVDFMDRDDQEMVQFYHEMARKAAEHHLTLTLHGAYKPTGMERTWPNVLSFEAVLNQEYNKWQPPANRGTPPEHNLDVAFVRQLAGPLDYHQGGMRSVLPADYHFRNVAPPVQGTRGHQLAMFVVYQNHRPMLADSPSAYQGQAGLSFLTTVPTTWDETRVLHAELGRCLVVARRRGTDWYLGGMTAPAARSLDLPLDFLGDGPYTVDLDQDRPADGPTALDHQTRQLTARDRLAVTLPPAGGFVAHLRRSRP